MGPDDQAYQRFLRELDGQDQDTTSSGPRSTYAQLSDELDAMPAATGPSIGERIKGALSEAAQHPIQTAKGAYTGMGESVSRMAQGGLGLLSAVTPGDNDIFVRAREGLKKASNEQVEKDVAGLNPGAAAVGRVGGNLVGEGAQYMMGGGALRTLSGKVPALARVGARMGTGTAANIAKDALAFAPLDVAVSAVGPENSTLGTLGEVTGSERMKRWAENPVTRALGEVGLGVAADLGLRGVGAALAAGRGAVGRAVRSGPRGALAEAHEAGKMILPPGTERLPTVDEVGSRFMDMAGGPEHTVAPRPEMPGAGDVADALGRIKWEGGSPEARRAAAAATGRLPLYGPEHVRLPTAEDVGTRLADISGTGGLPTADEIAAALNRKANRTIPLGPSTVPEPKALPRPRESVVPEGGMAPPEPVVPTRGPTPEPAPVPEPAPALEAPTPRAEVSAPTGYEHLSDDELRAKWAQYQRGYGRTSVQGFASHLNDAGRSAGTEYVRPTEHFSGTQDVSAGIGGSPNSRGWKDRGRMTQAEDRIANLEKEFGRRGLTPPEADPYLGVGRSDVLDENKDLVGTAGENLRSMDDEQLANEVQSTLSSWEKNRESPVANERMALLYAEANRPGRNIDPSVFGHSLPELARWLGRIAAGSTIGGLVAPEGHKGQGIVGGAFAGAFGPEVIQAAAKGLRRMGTEGHLVTPAGIKAWHGSPADFDRFSLDYLRTGEGANAYSPGLYFAEAEQIGRDYRRKLAGKPKGNSVTVNGADVDRDWERVKQVVDPDDMLALNDVIYYTRLYKDPARGLEEAVRTSEPAARFVEKYDVKPVKGETPGQLYEVNLKSSLDKMVDYDHPFSEQPQAVQDGLNRMIRNAADKYGAGSIRGVLFDINHPNVTDADRFFLEKARNRADAAQKAVSEAYQRGASSSETRDLARARNAADEAYQRALNDVQRAHPEAWHPVDDVGRVLSGLHDALGDREFLSEARAAGLEGVTYRDAFSRDVAGGRSLDRDYRNMMYRASPEAAADLAAKSFNDPTDKEIARSVIWGWYGDMRSADGAFRSDPVKFIHDIASGAPNTGNRAWNNVPTEEQIRRVYSEMTREPTSNYVMYDDNLIEIAKKHGVTVPELLQVLARGGAGAAVGAPLGAALDPEHRGRGAALGAAAGAALAAGGPAMFRNLRDMGERGSLNLFGEDIPGSVKQTDLLKKGGPQGTTEALNDAKAVVSQLDARVKAGAATDAEVRRYNEARSLIRRSDGAGMDGEEVVARLHESKPNGTPKDGHTLDLFGDKTGRTLGPVPAALARTGAGALIGGAAASQEGGMTPLGGALAGGTAALVGPAAWRAARGAEKGVAEAAKAVDPDIAALRAVREPADKPTKSFLKTLAEDPTAPLRMLRQKLSKGHAGIERYADVVGDNLSEMRKRLAQGRGFLGSSTQYATEHLRPVIQAVNKAGADDVKDLLIGERALELQKNGYGWKLSASPEQTARGVEKLGQNPEVAAAADQVRDYFRKLLEMKRDAGAISAEQFDAITKNGDYYVPFVRDVEERVARFGGTQKYNRATGVRRMKKGDVVEQLAISDPLEMALWDTHETVRRVRKARVTNLVADIAEKNPEAAKGFLRELPGKPDAMLPKQTANGTIIDPVVNGKRRYYEITDPELADAFASMDASAHSALTTLMSKSASLMRAGVILQPAFSVANAMRDLGFSALSYPLAGGARRAMAAGAVGAAAGAALDEDHGEGALLGATVAVLPFGGLHLARLAAENTAAMKDIIGPEATGAVIGAVAGGLSADKDESATVRAIEGALAGAAIGGGARLMGVKRSGAYERFMAEGGGQFGFFGGNVERDAKRMVKRLGEDKDIIVPRSIGELVDMISHAVETAPRLAYYKRTGDIAGARDLSVDFAIKGSSKGVRALTRMTAFLNPAILGADKFARLLAKKETYPVALATLTAPAIALYMVNKDNPEYANVPLYQKALYYHIPKPGGGFFKIPKPFEPGALFATAPELAAQYAETGDKDALKASGTVLARQYGPESFLPIPTAIASPMEAFLNYDMFRRREIDPEPWRDIDPAYQYDERTSTIALALNKVPGLGGVSPARIDHVLRGLTGSLGSLVLDKVTELAKHGGLDDRQDVVNPVRVLARFQSNADAVGEVELGWRRRLGNGRRAYETVRKLVDDKKPDEARDYAQKHRDQLLQYLRYKDVDKFLSVVSKARKAIYEADVPREQKAEALGNLNRRVAELLYAPQQKRTPMLPQTAGR